MLGLGLCALAVLAWTLLLARAIVEFRQTPRPLPLVSTEPLPISAFIPARDEAEVIGACLTSLLAAPVQAITVIDDRSSDGTDRVLAGYSDPRLEILRGEGPGPGEFGKPAALRQAVRARPPETEWLLFLDADVILEPGGLSGLFAAARAANADLATIFPAIELSTLAEDLFMPTIAALVAARHPARAVADPSSPVAFANGQLILMRRQAYEAIGGHGAVIGEVLEDVRLAEVAKRAGLRLYLADGRALARTRMYAGLGELVQGWTKNLFLLVGGTIRSAALIASGSVFLASIGLVALLAAGWPFGVAAYLYTLGIQMLLRRLGGAKARWAILAPLSSLFCAYVIAESARRARTKGQIAWKGRMY